MKNNIQAANVSIKIAPEHPYSVADFTPPITVQYNIAASHASASL